MLGVCLHHPIFAQPEPANTENQNQDRGAGVLDTRLSTIHYDSGKIGLTEADLEELDYIVQLVKMNPDLVLSVQGHSDDQGSISRHHYLYEYRAWLVWAFLVSKGVPHQNITHYGFGFRKPLVGDVTKKARAENRRVEIHIVLPKNLEAKKTGTEN